MKRVILIILDSLGIGAMPDADEFGDAGASTISSISRSKELNIPNLLSLGLGNIDGVDCLPRVENPLAAYGRMAELSRGKDTTVGHWELAGVISEKPFPTYPDGFPEEIIEEFKRKTGRGVICNKPYSGTDVIRDFGKAHLESGDLIVYTSADSVFQIAAHEEIVSPKKLYEYCLVAREILSGEHCVGRVIARPFIGSEKDGFKRTANRHDFSAEPTAPTLLDALSANGISVIGVGKTGDIFAGRGITESYPTRSNAHGMNVTMELLGKNSPGFIFTNLVEFDSNYGHRQDADGYAKALSEFDVALGKLIPKLSDDDVLIISADHGCDPSDKSTDHTREYVPVLIYGKNVKEQNLGTSCGFTNVAALISRIFKIDYKVDFDCNFYEKVLDL